MQDLDKHHDTFNSEKSDDSENKDFAEEEKINVQDNKDIQEGLRQVETEHTLEEKADDSEEKSNSEEEKADDQEGGNDQAEEGRAQEQVGPDDAVNKECSSRYTPPYYVPNFTVRDGTEQQGNDRHYSGSGLQYSKKKPWKILAATVAVMVLVMGAFLIGAFSGRFTGGITTNSNEGIDLKKEGSIVVVKNSPQMQIQENMSEDYVPQSIPEVVQKVGNSVVEISTSSVVTDRFYRQYVTSGAGSGVIITQNDIAGYLLTNYHVVESAEEIVVRLTNKEEYKADVLGGSKAQDIAVVRIEKKNGETFTVAPIGDSSKLIVGQDILAIGNPLGSLGGTVTDGIISALDRNVSIDGVSMTLLQHNAAINPGNSGGALFDMMGNLVGIVNAKTSETGIEGLGFAIPINIAFEYFKGVMNTTSIGATVDYGYNSEHIYGVYVVKADSNSELKKYDRIIAINDNKIEKLDDFYACIDDFKTGDKVRITVVRDKAEKVIEVSINQNYQ